MTPILLVSGAGLPGWIWDRVRDDLGVTAVAERPRGRHASLGDYADAALDSAPGERFAVVAHSSGGVVAAEAAARAPGRVSAFLAVSAIVPAAGRSFVTSMPFPNRLVLDLVMRLAGTRPPEAVIRRGVAGGVDAETAGRIVADFHPESAGLYRDRLRGGGLPERRGYVVTGRDAELPEALQRRFAGNLGTHWTGTIDSGHLPMLEAPGTLTRLIKDFLAQHRNGVR